MPACPEHRSTQGPFGGVLRRQHPEAAAIEAVVTVHHQLVARIADLIDDEAAQLHPTQGLATLGIEGHGFFTIRSSGSGRGGQALRRLP